MKLKGTAARMKKSVTSVENALKQAEERYRDLFENATVGIYRSIPGGRYISANPCFARIMGYDSPEELIASVTDIGRQFYVDSGQREESIRLVNEHGSCSIDVQVHTRDGGTKWVSNNVRAVRDESGNILCFEGFIQDITPQKRAEEELKNHRDHLEQLVEERTSALTESEKKYRDLVDNALVGVYQTTLDGRILYLNDQFCRMLGFASPEEIDSSSPFYKRAGEREALVKTLLRGGRVKGYEVELTTKTGRPINVLLSATLKGGVISGMALDITERKRAEELVRRNERQYRGLIEGAPFPVVLSRVADGLILYANEAASNLFKQDATIDGEVRATRYYNDPSERDRIMAQVERLGFIKDYYICLRDEKGDQFQALLSATTISFNNETVLCASFNDVTRLTQAMEKLTLSEAKYKSLFDNANDAILLLDRGRYIDCNQKALTMFQRSKEEIIGRTPYTLSPPVQANGRSSKDETIDFRRIALSGGPAFFEWRHCRRDGSVFDTEVSINRIEIGEEQLLQAIVRDVSERKEADRKLRLSEEKYRSIFDNAVEGIFQSTPDGRYLSANPALARMYGYNSPQELINDVTDIGKEQYITPEDRLSFRTLLEAKDYIEGFETGIYTRQGRRVWISMNARVVRDAGGAILYYEGFAEDITKRREMEEALRKSEERYRTFIDSASDMVFLKDDRLRNLIVNKSVLTFFGKSEREIIGKTDFELMPAVAARTARLTDLKAIESSSIVISEQTIGERVYETRKFPVGLGQNKLGVGGFVRDITEQKQSEEELKVKSVNLREVNAALRVLLKQREQDRDELEERILYNVKKLIFPYVEKLRLRNLNEEQEMYLNILETNLRNILSPFVQKMIYEYSNFTPTEILVANFIKDGKTIKEIGSVMGVTENAVNRHRQHIRHKLGLNGKKINLKVHLMSFK